MAKVLLHSLTIDDSPRHSNPISPDDPHQGKWMQGAYKLFMESALADPFKVHSLTSDPAEADIIVFAELGAQGLFVEWVRRHPFVKKYREKCFLFDVADFTPAFLPGLYASLRKSRYNPARTRTGYYLRIDENPFIDFRPMQQQCRHLGSFVGTLKHHPVRKALKQLPADRFLIEDTSDFAQKTLFFSPEVKRQSFWPHYADAMDEAAFALSPRGIGTGSIRLFEAMQLGRCPVILSDEWVYPERVDWKACSITVAEKDVLNLPEILEQNLPRAAELGLEARKQWEKHYSPPVRFHWLVEDCLSMRSQRRIPEAIAGRLAWRYIFYGHSLRDYMNSKKQIYKATGKIVL